MKVSRFRLVIAAALVSSMVAVAWAEVDKNCVWSQQPDGSWWGTCVANNGRSYCRHGKAKGTAPEVSCKSK